MHDKEDVHVHFTHICTSGAKYVILSYLSDETE